MSVIPNADWYETTHHELGHVYYYMSYSTPRGADPPAPGREPRLPRGAWAACMGLAAMQKPFIEAIGLFPEGQQTDQVQTLLQGSARTTSSSSRGRPAS